MRVLSVRMPEGELRRLKSRAAARGKSLQAAVTEAVDIWMSQPERTQYERDAAFWKLRGSLSGGPDTWAERYQDKLDEWNRDHLQIGDSAGPPPRRDQS